MTVYVHYFWYVSGSSDLQNSLFIDSVQIPLSPDTDPVSLISFTLHQSPLGRADIMV